MFWNGWIQVTVRDTKALDYAGFSATRWGRRHRTVRVTRSLGFTCVNTDASCHSGCLSKFDRGLQEKAIPSDRADTCQTPHSSIFKAILLSWANASEFHPQCSKGKRNAAEGRGTNRNMTLGYRTIKRRHQPMSEVKGFCHQNKVRVTNFKLLF